MTETTHTPAEPGTLAYDDAFAELGSVVATLEAGGASLEATVALYERAVALQRRCEQLLGEAELRVQLLLQRADGSLAAAELPAGEVEG